MTIMQEKPVSAAHDLLILQRNEPLPAKFQDALQRKGFSSRITSKAEDIAPISADLADPILIINCGSKAGVSRYLRPLLGNKEILCFPTLVLGKDVSGLETELNKSFQLATVLPISCNPHEFLEALKYISRSYQRETGDSSESHAGATQIIEIAEGEQPMTVVPAEDEQAEDILPEEKSHHLFKQADSMPTLLFQQLHDFKLLESSLGGARYPYEAQAAAPKLADLFEQDDPVLQACQNLTAELGKWAGLHLRRTAYSTGCILRSLHFDEQAIHEALRASFLYANSFGRKNRSLLRKEYLGRGTIVLRKEICSLIKDSALKLSLEFKLGAEAKIIAAFGRLVGREEQLNDDPTYIAASAIMAAETSDRMCFQSGNWNPRAAYSLIRSIKAGKMKDFHPAVLCCLVKFLGEAVTESGVPAHLLPKAIREDPLLLEQAKATRLQAVNPGEAKVSIMSLAPGMRLSRPLFAFDGRQILSEDLTLDNDLIWRIWQLSAVRPLNSPVVVLKKGQKHDGEASSQENSSSGQDH